MLIPHLFPEFDNSPIAGFRLHRFEVLNWGTFHEKIWTLDLQGKTSLLTGVNGSGKSTLVDGLLTLLVPNRKRNYNQASTGSGKRERDEKSYIQGAYGGQRREDEYGSKTKFLRQKGTISILLGYFYNEISKKEVTLAQVLNIKESQVEKFFVIANQNLSIQGDFPTENLREIKQELKRKGAEIFPEFNKYKHHFLREFGLQSDKALDLFNQTISLKEVRSFNEFVRNQMLQKEDVQSKIDVLEKGYNDLTTTHKIIEKAKKQLEILDPLEKTATRIKELEPQIKKSEDLIKIAPAFFASFRVKLWQNQINQIVQKLEEQNLAKVNCESELSHLKKQENDLNFAINQNSISVRLKELKSDISTFKTQLNKQKEKANSYNKYALLLGFSEYRNYQTFDDTKQVLIPQKRIEIEQILAKLTSQRDEKIADRNELKKEVQELQNELTSLRQRKNQIPEKILNIRNTLIKVFNLQETDLPFVGELLQVKPEEQHWEGAIEKILHGFGLSILVPDKYYRQISEYINNNNLKENFSYFHVHDVINMANQRNFAPNTVPSKLEIKQDNQEFYYWLRDRLQQSYNYVCCDQIEEFKHHNKAITSKGLIKQSNDFYQKNDRININDRRNYILGWNNLEKIRYFEEELSQKEAKLREIYEQISTLETQKKQRESQNSWLEILNNFTDFTEIDWQNTEVKLAKTEQELAELMANSEQLKQLETQLKEVRETQTKLTQKRDIIMGKIGSFTREKEILEKNIKEQKIVDQFSELELQEFEITQFNTLFKPDLDNINEIQQEKINSLNNELNKWETRKRNYEKDIISQISKFRNTFPEDTTEMDNTMESLDEYLNLFKKIKDDDLPRHEQRFKNMMSDNIITSVSSFKQSLDDQEQKIKDDIYDLNKSLKNLNYSNTTYIELICEKNKDIEINQFRNNDLNNCLRNLGKETQEDNEERFQYISELIKKLNEQERWREKVTDVRNWLNFSVSERYQENGEEKEHYTESSGKSGGQKAKLAYTILAAAIALRYGLNQENSDQKSFRFVIIDEAFSKLDDNNARYAMELFKNLNLQLLVVTPKDKINVIDTYINSLHLVFNNKEENYSSIRSISIEEYRRQREIINS